MQRIETDSFQCLLLPDWTYFADDGGRLVCHGPDGEELIISVTTVENARDEDGDQYVDQVFDNAVQTMHRMQEDSELAVIKPPGLEPTAPVSCVFAVARTTDNAMLFSQLAFRGMSAVMFATLESVYSPKHAEILGAFIRSVRDRSGSAV